MDRDGEDFLRRWSRRKLDAPAKAPAAPAEAPPLPAPDSLTFESDFKAFMHSKVEEGVKRAALKKLFSDPHFNVMDGLDTYIDDYSKDDPIPAAMLAELQHSRTTLFGRDVDKKKEQVPEQPAPEELAQAPDPGSAPAPAPAPAPDPAPAMAESPHTDEEHKKDDGAAG